jgi:hypothetical protein
MQLIKMAILNYYSKDILGNYHFNSNFNNAVLKEALSNLDQEKYQSLIEKRQFATANVRGGF